MRDYCGNYDLNKIWVDGGVSACFLDTLGPAACAMCLLLASLRFQSSPVSRDVRTVEKKWTWMQLALVSGILAASIFELVGRISLHDWLPYHVTYNVVNIASWTFQAALFIHDQRTSRPTSVFSYLFIFGSITVSLLKLASWRNRQHFDFQSAAGLVSFIALLVVLVCAVCLVALTWRIDRLRNKRARATYHKLGSSHEMPVQDGWRQVWARVKLLAPYIWPVSDRWLQLGVLLCFGLLVIGRVVNVFLPLYYKRIVNHLTIHEGEGASLMPYGLLIMYAFLQLLQGGPGGMSGLLNNIRGYIWVSVTQYTAREMRISLFKHLHSMSLHWHLNRKTGEVLRIMDRGTDSVTTILSSVLFSIFPTIVDIVIAIIYFVVMFDALFGVLVMTTMVCYMVFTIVVTDWRTKFRVRMNLKDNRARQISVDSLLNFETVKYFGAEEFEVGRYATSIGDYQKEEFAVQASLNYLNTGQNLIISAGLLVGTLMCGYRVVEGRLTAGDFVLFIAYLNQLYSPLNFFGTYWRNIQQNIVDMENMFELFDVQPDIVDSPTATELVLQRAPEVAFKNVSFSYGDRLVINNISFTVPPGQTYAIVGTSGGGKSTLLRLLFRFFNLQEGSVEIDGQNIESVTQHSLRQAIGVVPQDTVLFNESIEYNIRYGKQGASFKEVTQAAKLAEMHSKILTFQDGYETDVGERGLRLSGGEKQRVAIARTILKDPRIVLLDEATSSLDTETERSIQSSLSRLGIDRTTLVVAHRLSTIIGADRILVINHGQIAEQGSHADLLAAKGLYYEMWTRQLEAEKDTHELIGSNVKM